MIPQWWLACLASLGFIALLLGHEKVGVGLMAIVAIRHLVRYLAEVKDMEGDPRCPACNHPVHHAPDSRDVKVGDFTLCIKCATILILDSTLTPRTPTVQEWSEVLANPQLFLELKEMQRRLLALNRVYRERNTRLTEIRNSFQTHQRKRLKA